MASELPKSMHFQVRRLTHGVYAAIASDQDYAGCNVGIIDIGDRTILFDTFVSPEAARDLLKVTEQLVSQRITHVINSHEHSDHIRGNQTLGSDVDIISTALTCEAIARNEPQEIEWEKETIAEKVSDAQSRLDAEKDEKRRHNLASSLAYLHAINKSRLELKMRLPNVTFEHRLTIRGTKRTIELLPLAGHTASDVVLILPEDKIAFMGDLLFVNCHPFLASGSPEHWKKSLDVVKTFGVQVVVPGHGPVGKFENLSLMQQYIQSLENIVANMIKCGKSIKQVSSEQAPSPFDIWVSPHNFFVTNLEFLYKRAMRSKNI